MIDEPFDNPHHGHADEVAMPREVILYPHEWTDQPPDAPAYRGPMHPEDVEGVRYVPAAAVETLALAIHRVILDACPVTDAGENVQKLWRINKALYAAVVAYRAASREPPR
jgi:hypothetical protein